MFNDFFFIRLFFVRFVYGVVIYKNNLWIVGYDGNKRFLFGYVNIIECFSGKFF